MTRDLGALTSEMKGALTAALKSRDLPAISALRSALAALANAEAVEAVHGAEGTLGYADVQRRTLTPEEALHILAREIGEREHHVVEYAALGKTAEAERLQREIDVLRPYLSAD